MKKIILSIYILIISSFCFAEDLTSFLGISFGSLKTEVCINMIKKGWKISDNSEKRIIFSGGDLNYESFVMFDQVVFYFTDNGTYYQSMFVLFDRDNNTENFNKYIQETITSEKLEIMVNTDNKKTYCSKDGYIFSYQLLNNNGFPSLVIEKGNPVIVKDERDAKSSFENLNPNLCTILQKGHGYDFYYIIADVPGTEYNAVYLCKTNDFESVVYLCLYPDPDGIKLANYIDILLSTKLDYNTSFNNSSASSKFLNSYSIQT